jgi:hypothetical protein
VVYRRNHNGGGRGTNPGYSVTTDARVADSLFTVSGRSTDEIVATLLDLAGTVVAGPTKQAG